MLKQIGTALGRAASTTERQPVRRHSYLVGRCEGTFWRRTHKQEVKRVLLAARRYELVGRGAGRRNGPLGHIALEVLELLTNLVSYRTGQLDPSVSYLMGKLRRSKDAVVRALAALRDHGFLDWLRRYEPTGCEGRGPQVRQVSNAYRLKIPPRALQLLGLYRDTPAPDDLDHDRQTRAAEVEAMKQALPLHELAVLQVDDGPLGRALAQLGSLVAQREYAKQEEPQTTGLA